MVSKLNSLYELRLSSEFISHSGTPTFGFAPHLSFAKLITQSILRGVIFSKPVSLRLSREFDLQWMHPPLSTFCHISATLRKSASMLNRYKIYQLYDTRLLSPAYLLSFKMLTFQLTMTGNWINVINNDWKLKTKDRGCERVRVEGSGREIKYSINSYEQGETNSLPWLNLNPRRKSKSPHVYAKKKEGLS